jgi:hypothetical protein
MTQLIGREHEGKKLRVVFKDGEVVDMNVSFVDPCQEHDDCRGLVYELIATNRAERIKKGSACWAHERDIEAFSIIGDDQDAAV